MSERQGPRCQGLQTPQQVRKRTTWKSQKKKKKTKLVCFSSNTYISQLWLIHSSKSSSILHPFLTVQTGTSIPISISTRGDGRGKKRGAFPRERRLDSEEERAGFWLGGEGRLPGLTSPPNSPPLWLTGGPHIPQRPGCSALRVLSQRARLAEFKARCIAAWWAAGRRDHQCKSPSQRGPRLGPGVGAGRAAMPSWAKQRSQAGVDRNRMTTHRGQSLLWTHPNHTGAVAAEGQLCGEGPSLPALALGVRQHSYPSPGPFCPSPAPGGISGTPPGSQTPFLPTP